MPRAKKVVLGSATDYNLTVKVGHETFTTSAPSIPEAIEKLTISKIFGKISVMVQHLGKTYTFQFVKPLFFKKTLISNEHRALFEKRAKQFLGEILV